MATHSIVASHSESRLSSTVSGIQAEVTDAAQLRVKAFYSLAWIWPIRGLFYALMSEFEADNKCNTHNPLH